MTTKTKGNLTYRTVGDFRIPNLTLLPEEANITLGKWGMLYKNYLLNHEKVVFSTLLAEGKLYQHCAEIENQARNMLDTLVEQMKVSEGVTEHLKEQDQLEWVQRMNNIHQRANEIVFNELIYTLRLLQTKTILIFRQVRPNLMLKKLPMKLTRPM